MMTSLSYNLIAALAGRTLVTAESCTGGGIGAALTAVPGSSAVYKGGIICYTNEVKNTLLGVSFELLDKYGAVSAQVAEAMALGVRKKLNSDYAISVTGLAGPTGDDFGNPVGTVFLGFCDKFGAISREFHFTGEREEVRKQAIISALELICEKIL